MDTLEALVLGLIQGLTEYLPVSSSGHLAIGSAIFDVDPDKNMMFTVLVHVATVLSTLVVLGGKFGNPQRHVLCPRRRPRPGLFQ